KELKELKRGQKHQTSATRALLAGRNTQSSPAQDEAKTGSITITKAIDFASPRLFHDCVKKTVNKWAVISLRESGEPADEQGHREPWLVIELQNVTVAGFQWEVTPGDAEGAAHQETVHLDFQTILIKYTPQDVGGMH